MRAFWVLPIPALAPLPAQAIVAVRVEQGCPGAVASPPPVRLEVFLDPGPGNHEDEQLNRFQVKLDLFNASPDGIHFGGFEASGPGFPPVFPGVALQDLGSDFDTIFVSAALPPGKG